MSNLQKFQLTLCLLKPDVTHTPFVLQAIKSILHENFFIVRHKKIKLKRVDAENFYSEHKEKFFYTRLTTFMSSGPLHAFILGHTNAIRKWREMMGPTKVYKTHFEAPDTIRGTYGLTDTRNTTHGSDSFQSAIREIEFFFPEFNFDSWYNTEEERFLKNEVIFDEDDFIHTIKVG